MALSFTEKRALQKVIATNLAALAAGNLSFTDKRGLQKGIQDAFIQLKEIVNLQPDAAAQNQKLADLIAGKFNTETPEVFLKVLKDIITEINDVKPVIEPTVKYIEVNKSLIAEAAEMAFAEVFGKRFEQIRIFEAARA